MPSSRVARTVAARAAAAGAPVPSNIAAEANAAREAARKADLGDPQTQAEILAAPHYDCDLLLYLVTKDAPEGKYVVLPIRVPLEFALHDIVYRNVMSDVAGFAAVVAAEIREITPASILASSENLVTQHPAYVTAALKRPGPRNALIDVIAKVAKTRDEDESKQRAVSAFELHHGIESDDLVVIAMRLLVLRQEDEQRRKKARAAAGKGA